MSRFTQSALTAPDTLTVKISLRHLRSAAAFAERIAQVLSFPRPCPNADALDDLMRDLAWQPESRIRIRFEHLRELHNQTPALARQIADHLATWREYWQQPRCGKTVSIHF